MGALVRACLQAYISLCVDKSVDPRRYTEGFGDWVGGCVRETICRSGYGMVQYGPLTCLCGVFKWTVAHLPVDILNTQRNNCRIFFNKNSMHQICWYLQRQKKLNRRNLFWHSLRDNLIIWPYIISTFWLWIICKKYFLLGEPNQSHSLLSS